MEQSLNNFQPPTPVAMGADPAPSAGSQGCAIKTGTITSLESLQEHLQWAIELEHSTIPPYLCALYSIVPGKNPEAVDAISSVVVEEMLHLTLAANLLNAVGGRPRLAIPKMISGYPKPLPHGDRSFEISLWRFGPQAIETFLKIETPSSKDSPAEGDNYETIGQFYEAIRRGLSELCATLGETNVFCGDPARQITNEHVYSGSGRIIAVTNLASAQIAIEEIVEQGEGAEHVQVWDEDVFHPTRDEVAHYYRFQELKLGRRYRRGDTPLSGPTGDLISIDWRAVRPVRTNPRISEHAAGSPIRLAQEEFNSAYFSLLQTLELAFDGAPQTLESAMGVMFSLKALAQKLMQMPTEDGLEMAGPSFEYFAPARRGEQAVSNV